jgi:hypothetical protein
LVTINWTAPTENESIGGEFLAVADGLAQALETTYDPVVSGEIVYEMSNFGGVGRGDTTLTANAPTGSKFVTIALATNLAIGDWIQIDGGGNTEYFQIDNINVLTLELSTRVLVDGGFTSGATVKEADAVVKTGSGTDYTITPATGVVDIVAGQFTASNHIVIAYATTLSDLDGYTLLRNPVLFADSLYDNVILDGNTVVVSDAIGAGALTFQETLAADENGETWYYYLYAKDDESTPNRSEIASGGPLLAETLPSIPQSLGKTVGDMAVMLSWAVLGPGASDANTDGYNIYRNPGPTLDAPNLLQLNAIVIPKAQVSFDDSAAGVGSGDRVSAGTVALPANGQFYTYVVESEDTASAWTTGTQNQSFGQGAQTIASKTA